MLYNVSHIDSYEFGPILTFYKIFEIPNENEEVYQIELEHSSNNIVYNLIVYIDHIEILKIEIFENLEDAIKFCNEQKDNNNYFLKDNYNYLLISSDYDDEIYYLDLNN